MSVREKGCPLCGRKGRWLYKDMSDRLYHVKGNWAIKICKECQLSQLHPLPTEEEIPFLYPQDYCTHEAEKIRSWGSGWKRACRNAFLRTFLGYQHLAVQYTPFATLAGIGFLLPVLRGRLTKHLGRQLLPFHGEGKLLDIGCGDGTYLKLMQELGWTVAGVELDPEAADLARKKTGAVVHQGALKTAPFPEESLDVVTLNHVIEHLPDPSTFLNEATRYLKSSGMMLFVTPNLMSLGAKAFQRDWYPWDVPRHLHLFSPTALLSLLRKNGSFKRICVWTRTKAAEKVYRKAQLVKKTGSFQGNERKHTIGSLLFALVESLGNPLLRWGEEIECIALKK